MTLLSSNVLTVTRYFPAKILITTNAYGTQKDVKRISVVSFRDDSYKDQKIIRGYGMDGIVYTLIVTPRTAIPFILSPSDDSYHEPSNRRRVTRIWNTSLFKLDSISLRT